MKIPYLTTLLPLLMAAHLLHAGEFKVGAAQVDITPGTGAPMAGYYSFRPVEGALDPLYAKAIVVEQDGSRAAFVVLDLVTTTDTLVSAARRLIQERCELPPERVMISATHTHTGPALPRGNVMDDLTKAGSPPGIQYATSLPELIAKSVSDALAQLTPARASATVGASRRRQLQSGSECSRRSSRPSRWRKPSVSSKPSQKKTCRSSPKCRRSRSATTWQPWRCPARYLSSSASPSRRPPHSSTPSSRSSPTAASATSRNREAYPQGNYEVVSARGAEGSGERLLEEALKLLRVLAGK
jgi:hypothetical protein